MGGYDTTNTANSNTIIKEGIKCVSTTSKGLESVMFVRMIVRLFSIFDPSRGSISMNWVSVFLFIVFYWRSWWYQRRVSTVQWKGRGVLIQEIVSVMGVKRKSVCLIVPLFISILLYNSIGLLPYVFTSTRHIAATIALALPLWGCVCVLN